LIKYEFGEFSGEWGFVVYECKTNQERNSLWYPAEILMGLSNDVELPSKIKNKILSKYGELEKNANS